MNVKKFAALVMALVLCMTAASAMAAVTTTSDLIDAINNVSKGGTITLGADIAGHGIVIPEGKEFVLDFDGHTYTVNGAPLAGSNGTKTQAFQILKGSKITFKDGTINVASKDIGVKMLVQNYSSVTMHNMVLDGRNLQGTDRYVFSNNCGDSAITGNTSILAKDGDFAFDVYDYANYGGASLTINTTGNIVGEAEVGGQGNNKKAKLTINKVGSGSNMEITVTAGVANMKNLPVGTEVHNMGGEVTANGVNVDSAYIIPAPVKVDMPATGDESSVMLWSFMLTLAVAGFVAMGKKAHA